MISIALDAAAARLDMASASARLDAELLLAHVLGVERGRLLARTERALTPQAAARYAGLVARRAAGEPVAYLLGRREFWSLTLEVGPAVLVPRPETELLVELALECLRGASAPAVLDLGAGSGAVGLAIAHECPAARVDLVDTSAAAVAVAQRNRTRLALGNARTLCGHWYAPVAGSQYAVIVANPPYLAANDPHLVAHELRYEPRSALVAGPTGLEAIDEITRLASAHLVPGGALILEHGAAQGEATRSLFESAGLAGVATHRDLAGLERATLGRRPG
jgi:release factor glutamine methyltransferase